MIKDKYEEYLESYRVLGFGESDFMKTIMKNEAVVKVAPYVSMSTPMGLVPNDIDNGIVVIEQIFHYPDQVSIYCRCRIQLPVGCKQFMYD